MQQREKDLARERAEALERALEWKNVEARDLPK